MPGRIAEVAAVSVMALVVTVAIAAPVLRAPSDRVFGMEIVGRHHDPFTVMERLARPASLGVYGQPVTDVPGALFARLSGPVAGYNWLVLLSFPLSAAAAYLLARHLALSRVGATVAAMMYAFSPFHLTHAAYHAHIAQTQWLPLYFLALWRCLDSASPKAMALLGAAAIAVVFSNFYAGLIVAVTTPVAVGAYWLAAHRPGARSIRPLGMTVGGLVVVGACGLAYAWSAAGAILVNPAAFAFPRADLFRYSAKWWSYLVPPVEHPLLGAAAHRFWTSVGVGGGLLEQQVSLGWGVVALGLIALFAWASATATASTKRSEVRQPSLTYVPVLVLVAVTALVCSLSPERTIEGFTFVRPSALLYSVVPMFRSYARFGVVVQLMAALLAGIGVEWLRCSGTRRGQMICAALVLMVVGEYAVSPSALSRDVLPTAAHRWIVQQDDNVRVLDCTPFDEESESVQWLTGYRVHLQERLTSDCTEPNLPQKLAAWGYTHLLVRRDAADGRWFADHATIGGLRVVANFDDARVFAVTAATPVVYTSTMTGMFPRERDAEWSWRWMGKDAAWTIVNSSPQPISVTLSLEMSAFHHARLVDVRFNGGPLQSFLVEPSHRVYQIGPFTVAPGEQELVFHANEAPEVAGDVIDNGDSRRLSFALGTWTWSLQGEDR